ncbi:hypothetical protein BCR39DRAFT_513271 [Naematelia encephala]|uniref:Zn(2)-C6 fungal-type domain-containing protein n=1 Tax=Naematelia encephala TaxID=71784 RepID=A0A1Y2BIY2_9TREE|nr:hypothetical protein BCR39DRAFT_513271 [Naematelia encephala]
MVIGSPAHGTSPDELHEPSAKRTRIRLACKRCRSRKTKCDNARPCAACISVGLPCRDWRPDGPRPSGHPAERQTGRVTSDEATTCLPELASPSLDMIPSAVNTHDSTTPLPNSTHNSAERANIRSINPSLLSQLDLDSSMYAGPSNFTAQPHALEEQGQRIQPFGLGGNADSLPPYNARVAANPVWPLVVRDLRHISLSFPYDSLYRNEAGQLKYLATSSGLSALTYLSAYQSQINAHRDDAIWRALNLPAIDFEPQPRATFSQAASLPQSEENIDIWEYVLSKVDETDIESLLATFLETLYPLWPTFIARDLQTRWSNSANRDNKAGFVCLVLAVCAVTAKHVGLPNGAEDAAGFAFYDLIPTVKDMAPTSADWNSLDYIQALFYLSQFCYTGSGRNGVAMGHSLINEAVSRAIDSGIHRSNEAFANAFTPSEREVRCRTLWAVFCGDKISAAYGRPVMMRLADIDCPEIDVVNPYFLERLSSHEPSLLSIYRAHIRLMGVLERVLSKVNLPSCSCSNAICEISHSPRRPIETQTHNPDCSAEHSTISFSDELLLIDKYRCEGIIPFSQALDDDNMYHAQKERLRTSASFIHVLIYRHLVAITNNDLAQQPPDTKHMHKVVEYSLDLLASQRKMLGRKAFTDFGGTISYQISQIGRALQPILYILRYLRPGAMRDDGIVNRASYGYETVLSLLTRLSIRFSSSLRSKEILQNSGVSVNEDWFQTETTPQAPVSQQWLTNLPLETGAIDLAVTSHADSDFLPLITAMEMQPSNI